MSDELDDELSSEIGEGTPGAGESEESEEIPKFLGDFSEEDVLSRLRQVDDVPTRFGAVEDRMNGAVRQIMERMGGLEKSLKSRASFKPEALAALKEHDAELATILEKVLPQAFDLGTLDEGAMRPFLESLQQKMSEDFNWNLVNSHYTPEELDEIIPTVSKGQFAPTTQRQKDFVEWYGKQGYSTQQSLLQLGAPYVRAVKSFEKWEDGRKVDRAAKGAEKGGKLRIGAQPSSRGKRATQGAQTAEEAFLAGYNEISQGRN